MTNITKNEELSQESHSQSSHSRREFLQMLGVGAASATAATCLPAIASASTMAQTTDTNANAATTEAKYVEYWTGWRGLEFDELAVLTTRFNEMQDEIAVTMYHAYDGADQLWEAVSAGTPPDVVSAIELNQMIDMAASGTIQPLTDFAIVGDIKPADYLSPLWNSWVWQDQLWCVMMTANIDLMAYNADLFTDAKVAFPKTIDDLDKVASTFDEFDDEGAMSRAGFLPQNIYFWGQVFGGDFYDASKGRITADNDKVVAALEWIDSYTKRIGAEKAFNFVQSFGEYNSEENSFFAGQEAMVQTGEWFTLFQEYFAPEMNMEMAPVPAPKGGRSNFTTVGGSIFTIPVGAFDPEASWELIQWLQADEQMTEFCTQIQNLPAKVGPGETKYFTENSRFSQASTLLKNEEITGPDQMPVNQFLINSLYEAENKVLTTQLSPRKALEQVNESVQKYLDETWEGWDS